MKVEASGLARLQRGDEFLNQPHAGTAAGRNAGVQRDGVVERAGRYACGPDESRSISEDGVAE